MESSPFARLPGELQNEIWRLSVIQPGGVRVSYKQRTLGEPALLATCRQICREASGIYYAENAFLMDIKFMHMDRFYGWLSIIGAARAGMIRDLRICCAEPSAWAVDAGAFDEVVRKERGKSVDMWFFNGAAEMEVKRLLSRGVRLEAVKVMDSILENGRRDVDWWLWKVALEDKLEEARREGRVALSGWDTLRKLIAWIAEALNPWGARD